MDCPLCPLSALHPHLALPAEAAAFPTQSTCTVISLLPFAWVQQWADTDPKARPRAQEVVRGGKGMPVLPVLWGQTAGLFL